ncbi:hypothetical protein D3C73_1431000 [compost metagenome]
MNGCHPQQIDAELDHQELGEQRDFGHLLRTDKLKRRRLKLGMHDKQHPERQQKN